MLAHQVSYGTGAEGPTLGFAADGSANELFLGCLTAQVPFSKCISSCMVGASEEFMLILVRSFKYLFLTIVQRRFLHKLVERKEGFIFPTIPHSVP